MMVEPIAVDLIAVDLELAGADIGHLVLQAVQRISMRPTMRMMALNM
jgi:hypothetical protein